MPHAVRRLTRLARPGFTLPEILIVIVMISVLALVAIPRFANVSGKRHLESASMRVAAALVTARQAAIQKGQTVRFSISSNRVKVQATGADTSDLVSPVPLDTLYKVTAGSNTTIEFTSRGFATLSAGQEIILTRDGVGRDTVVVSKNGMVQR
jgi:prepilin-type N-terminal cleavage/methylation domain-containing protein